MCAACNARNVCRRDQIGEKPRGRRRVRRVLRHREPVQNRLALECRGRARSRTTDGDGCRRVVGSVSRIAEVDRVRQRDEAKPVGLGDRLIIVDVVQLAGGEERGQLGRIGSDVSLRRVLEQRAAKAALSVVALGQLEHEQCTIAHGREVRIRSADFDARPPHDLHPIVRCDLVGEPRPVGVRNHHPVSREVGVPRRVGGHEQLRDHIRVGQQDDVGNAVELGDLADVLERRAAFALNHDAGASTERIEHRLHRLRQARGDEDEERVGEDHVH